MPDIAVVWDIANARGDWVISGPDLKTGADLYTAVLVSLFSDAAAQDGDVNPDGSTDRRGWWGSKYLKYPLGSRLWLLTRAKKTEATRQSAQDYAVEALQWLITEGVAATVDVTAAWQDGFAAQGVLGLRVVIAQPDGSDPVVMNFQWAWSGLS